MFQTNAARSICLFGDVVNDDGSVTGRQYVVLANGRILSVGPSKPAGVSRPDYALGEDELIFPSFLDLHTHSTYNMLPLWHSPVWAWDNRFQWRANAQYKQQIGGANHAIVATSGDGSKTYAAINAFAELMAIAGGTTVLQESANLDGAGFPRRSHILIRNTGSSSDMGLSDTEQIASVVDFYEPSPYSAPRNPYQDTSSWTVKQASKGSYDGSTYVGDFALSVTGTRTRGTIVHLAEGRSGFLQTVLGADAYSRSEFETFKQFITTSYRASDIESVREARLVLVHGCGMSPNADTIRFLKTYGIAVIWSPVSNLLLYQDTTNIVPLLDAGVPVALGTDWTPSGSKTAWEEAKFAADFLETRSWKGNASLTCFKSITSVPADLLGLPLGRVREGNFADLVVIRRPDGARRGDALRTFRTAGDADVRAVLVGGVPLYGDADVLKALGAAPLPLPDERPAVSKSRPRVASSKAFVLPSGCGITLDDLTRALETADHIVGRNRPKLLAADDADYQSRMGELRAWVQDFGSKVRPTPKPVPPPPSGLAPGELEWMYNPSLDPKNRLSPDIVDLLGRIAPCRDERCAVPERHPYYHAEVLEEAGDSYGFRVPCMPVVPVVTNRNQLFVMGDYPTAKFTARSTNALPVFTSSDSTIATANDVLKSFLGPAGTQAGGNPQLLETYVEEIDDLVRGAFARPATSEPGGRSFGASNDTPPRKNEFFVPVGDVFAPMQDANYFDGYKVRNVASGVFLEQSYFEPVGIDVNSQVWLTNMVKCFLFHPENVSSYQALGWTDVRVEASYSELLPVGKVCCQWVNQEVQVCDPKLVLSVGKPPCVLLHNVPFGDAALQGLVYNELLGVRLPANDSRLEIAIAEAMKLSSRYPPPFSNGRKSAPAAATKSNPAVKAPSQPVSITRIAPWARYNVFHMMHPQAVMMAQTTVSTTMLSAIQLTLGSKANGMSVGELNEAIAAYLRTHSTSDLIKALPFGQRDTLKTNSVLLERHAVTLANFADTLVDLRLVSDKRVQPKRVLAQQAALLANTFWLADSADAELKRLEDMRDGQAARIARYLRGKGGR